MLMITELLTPPTPGPLWRLVKQAGIDHLVTLLAGGGQLWRWPEPGQQDGPPPSWLAAGRTGLGPPGAGPATGRLPGVRARTRGDRGHRADGRGPARHRGRDEQISWLHDQIRAMGELGIGTLCYNWHAVTGWARTHHDVRCAAAPGPAATTTRRCGGRPQ
jgi:mannonate dehydratase